MVTATRTLIEDFISSLNSYDFEKMASFYADEAVDECVGTGQVMHGKNEIKAFFKQMEDAFPDFKFKMKNYFESGEWIAAEWDLSGTHKGIPMGGIPPSGKSFTIKGADILQMRSGKIYRKTSYWNMMDFLKQVGAVPGSPAK